MIDFPALEAVALSWLRASSRLGHQHVIASHQDNPEPRGPYITLTLAESADTLGMYPEQGIDEEGRPFERSHWVFNGSIDAWRAGAFQLLAVTKSRLLLPSYYKILQDAGLSAQLDQLLYIPTQHGSQWEDHAQIGVTFNFGSVLTVDDGAEIVAPDGSSTGPQPIGWFNSIGVSFDELQPRPIPPFTISNPDSEE